MSRAPRPRYGRIAAFTAAVLTTGVSLLGGVGVLPGGSASYAASRPAGEAAVLAAATPSGKPRPAEPQQALPDTTIEPLAEDAPASPPRPSGGVADAHPVPPDSGDGRRIVFDMSDQRVWLVRRDGEVRRTYLVSGSVEDNLAPGTYEVYSRSRHAIGIDDSGTMEFMVRFAHGTRAAIGFHSIPTLDGQPVQTRAELGSPRSHGCVRQWRPDAKALWRFAPLGTAVVVTS